MIIKKKRKNKVSTTEVVTLDELGRQCTFARRWDARKLPTAKAKTHIVHSFTVTRGISVHETVKVSNNFQRGSSSLGFSCTRCSQLVYAILFTVNNFPPF